MEAAPEDLAKVEETVRRLLELMNLELELRIEVEPTGLFIGLEGADEKRLTADNGELMASIQFLLNRMARRGWPSVARISLAHDHRDHARDEELIELVREVAQQVESTGDAKRLHEMNAYERRLVHVTIRQTEGLGSRSEGNGSLKRVKIYKQEAGDQ
jgi:spoIIIJ-associated protein